MKSILSIALLLSLNLATVIRAEDWPGWRGARGDGSSSEKNVPIKWNATENITWKAELPGLGHASPIVSGDRVFTVSAIPETEARALICLDRKIGKILWQQTVVTSPLEKKHKLNSQASSTPATDGKLIYVTFLDVQDMVVAAYDFSGKQQWLVRPGQFKSVHGFCSSPVLHNDKVIVNGDHDGDSYIVALDKLTGKTLWKTPRANKTRSYCIPIILQLSGRTQMILSGDKSIASYNPDTGKPHWYIKGPTEQFVASLVYNPKADLLFMTGGFPQHHLLGLRHNGKGDLGNIMHVPKAELPQVAWHHTKASMVSYVPSPISEGDYFLIVSDNGMANCLAAATGELAWQEKIGSHHASLVSANGLVYFVADNGVTTVVKPGPKFEVVAKNELGEGCFASPAISNGQIFIRGDRYLYCIGGGKQTAASR
ncbi:MAG: serine/threonine protein kinase [Pedosphaera sp.]|nr:serine/threonine protein kinase [Pedosphaera sp.]MST00759.1 serine/threonine protein kinase [Pedosphaera sp.]